MPPLCIASRIASCAPDPSGAGAVMWYASAVAPYPTSSATILAPRASARSHSSRITAAAPSPITKPSRSLSNGRLAVVGSSLRSDSAFMFAKLAIERGVIAASDPPATMTSALLSRISSKASPSACADEAHADTVQ